jgi:hypothetical protein
MTREEFIKVLDKERYSYKIEGDKVVVTHKGNVYLRSLTSLPPGVVFKNEAGVNLNSLGLLSPDVDFKNGGSVGLDALTSLPPGVVFRNGGYVGLDALTSLPPGVEFNNRGYVYLDSLTGDWFSNWKGNIEGIDEKRLLNKMISLGLFEKRR